MTETVQLMGHTPRRLVFSTPAFGSGGKRHVVKRSCPRSEQVDTPLLGRRDHRDTEMIENEVAAIEYVRQHTTIPVPRIVSVFEDRDCLYMVQELVENAVDPVSISPYSAEGYARIRQQLENFVEQLRGCHSDTCRSFVGAPFFSYRFWPNRFPLEHADYRPRNAGEPPYILCHQDLSWHNILVDPETYEIKCIIDWEYASFVPAELEGEYWKREGPNFAIEEAGDRDDEDAGAEALYSRAKLPERLLPSLRAAQEFGSSAELGRKPASTGSEVFTKAQTRLRKLDIGYPPSRCELANTASIMQDCQATVTDFASTMTRYHRPELRRGMVFQDRPLSFAADTRFQRQLSSDLHTHFRTLSSAYQALPRHLEPLVDRLCVYRESELIPRGLQIAEDQGGWMYADIERRAFGVGPIRIGPITQGEAEQTFEKGEIRCLADQAYGEVEREKWAAITNFANSLLQLATAATSLRPYLATSALIQPPPTRDRERHIAEARTTSVLNGGSGGWKIQVVDDPAELEAIREKAGKEWDDARAAEQAEKERRERFAQEMEERRKELEAREFWRVWGPAIYRACEG